MSKKYQDNLDYWKEVEELRDALKGINILERLTALESELKDSDHKFAKFLDIFANRERNWNKKIEALESALKLLAEKIFMNMDDYRGWLKQLEVKGNAI